MVHRVRVSEAELVGLIEATRGTQFSVVAGWGSGFVFLRPGDVWVVRWLREARNV